MMAPLLPGMVGVGGGVEIVVADVGLHFDEEVGVEVVVAGASVVVAGEALDGGGALLHSEHLDMAMSASMRERRPAPRLPRVETRETEGYHKCGRFLSRLGSKAHAANKKVQGKFGRDCSLKVGGVVLQFGAGRAGYIAAGDTTVTRD